jgi:hypothetical protein
MPSIHSSQQGCDVTPELPTVALLLLLLLLLL